jgi:hypothetical protein
MLIILLISIYSESERVKDIVFILEFFESRIYEQIVELEDSISKGWNQ